MEENRNLGGIKMEEKKIEYKDWKMNLLEEYTETKSRYNKLHDAIVKREAGILGFEPKETIDIWKRQASSMGQYLYTLEIRMVINGIKVPKM